jgi:hypothetical protein
MAKTGSTVSLIWECENVREMIAIDDDVIDMCGYDRAMGADVVWRAMDERRGVRLVRSSSGPVTPQQPSA